MAENTLDNNDATPVIFRVTAGEWHAFKTLRLEALRLEPSAFGSTLAEAITWPDSCWIQRLTGEGTVDLAVRAGNRLVGMVGAWFPAEPEDAGIAIVSGMYVTKDFRGTGLARRLVHDLIDRVATRPDIQILRLWVNQDREPARRLYESCGFRAVFGPAPETPDGDETSAPLVMERPRSLNQLRLLRGAPIRPAPIPGATTGT